METKYKYTIMAIKNLGHGEGMKISLDHPWGLYAVICRRKKQGKLTEDVHCKLDTKTLWVYREPAWKELSI